MPKLSYEHIASRVLNTPLMIEPRKMDAIMGVLGPRFGIDASALPEASFVDTEATAEKRAQQAPAVVENGVAVIDVADTLVHETNGCSPWSGMTSYQWISGQLDQAVNDHAVRAIALRINSPGGECGSCFGLAEHISKIDSIKPVYAVVSNLAASAAYALASSARMIIAGKDSAIGSIGVIVTHYDRSASAEKSGLKVTYLHAGARKADLAPYRSLDPEAEAAIMEQINDLYSLFVSHVATRRGLDEQAVRDTQAQMFMGERAQRLGLVDAIMSEADALSWIGNQITSGGQALPKITATKRSKAIMPKSQNSTSASGVGNITGEDPDRIHAEGADTIEGEGADTIEGEGADTIEGEGADTIEGEGADTMGAEGDDADTLEGASAAVERQRCLDIVALADAEDFGALAGFIASGVSAMEAAKSMKVARVERQNDPIAKRRSAMPKPVGGAVVPTGAASMSEEDKLKAAYNADADLQAEFGTFEAYAADWRAEQKRKKGRAA